MKKHFYYVIGALFVMSACTNSSNTVANADANVEESNFYDSLPPEMKTWVDMVCSDKYDTLTTRVEKNKETGDRVITVYVQSAQNEKTDTIVLRSTEARK